ncbi:hypothetical protein D9615_001238 [Tricholomella constricta]|uniref:Uncharacterized protein n=1 Tax=Tricholomella constricta TaxID=117010 RepID=A0A8H5HL24_9AGAR|nr:hypothetical protein D9615_001238 [Tricholomella constricta]
MLAQELKKPIESSKAEWMQCIMKNVNYNLEDIRKCMALKVGDGRLLRRIFSAYTDDKMFSVDLVGAVLRQGLFIKKMQDLHWTAIGFFDSLEDELVLKHAIARYHSFLDLMSSSPASFFVPTLDIDLVWHTHQMMGSKYDTHCMLLLRRLVDHDDKVEESRLSSAFDITFRAWKMRFGLPYTYCGCPLPGDTIGQKLVRLVFKVTRMPHLLPPDQSNAHEATHPSDHNAVFVYHRWQSHRNREKQQKKLARRKKREAQSGESGDEHDPAFLIPIPMHYTTPGGCVIGSGSIVDNREGTAGEASCVPVPDVGPGGGAMAAEEAEMEDVEEVEMEDVEEVEMEDVEEVAVEEVEMGEANNPRA